MATARLENLSAAEFAARWVGPTEDQLEFEHNSWLWSGAPEQRPVWERVLTFIQSPVGAILVLFILGALGLVKSEADKEAFLQAVAKQQELLEKIEKHDAPIELDIPRRSSPPEGDEPNP